MTLLSEKEAESWGKTYGRDCGQIYEIIPDEPTARGTLRKTCEIFRRSFDEPAFERFFAAAKKQAADEMNVERKAALKCLVKSALDRGLKTSPGGGVGYHIGTCACPLDWYVYEREIDELKALGKDAVKSVAGAYYDHCQRAHTTNVS